MFNQRMRVVHRSVVSLCMAVCIAVSLQAVGQTARAQVTYTYTGNAFFPTGPLASPFTSTSKLTAIATFNTAPTAEIDLAADTLSVTLQPLDSAPISITLDLGTSLSTTNKFTFSGGLITSWDISLSGRVWRDTGNNGDDTLASTITGDSASLNDSVTSVPPPAAIASTPDFGTWSGPQAAIPEPGSMLLGTALALVGGIGTVVRRRRQRKQKET